MSEEMREIVRRITAADKLLVVTHARPDGDALGSLTALCGAAKAAGKQTASVVPSELPERYDFLTAGDPPARAEKFAELAEWADVVVIVDTCAFAQLDNLDAELAAAREKIVVIDHHATTDDIGSVRWLDVSAAAAGVMVGELLDALGWPVDRAAGEALLTAMTTDTGWFRFSNTDGRCLRAAARLFDSGVRVDELYRRLFQTDRAARVRLLARALSSMALAAGGRIATMKLRRADFAATDARQHETENIVNEPLRIGSVEVSMLLTETDEPTALGAPETCRSRISLRSHGRVDVAQIARLFGGGGHVRAAGLRSSDDIDTIAEKLVAACEKALSEAGGS